MNRSAASSSSPVVTPGRAFFFRISWQRTSTRPAAAIFSISSGVLRWITWLQLRFESLRSQCGTYPVVHLVGRTGAVEAHQQVLLVVPLDQRLGLVVVHGQPLADGLWLVVVALDEPRAVLVAHALVLRRGELHVVDVVPLRAGPPPRQPAHDLVVRRLDQEHGGQVAALALEDALEHLSLAHGAREAVEEEAFVRLARVEALLDS